MQVFLCDDLDAGSGKKNNFLVDSIEDGRVALKYVCL